MPAKKQTTFGARDIGEAINNVIVMARHPATSAIPETRFARGLRPTTIALVEPLEQLLDEGELLTAEEAVVVLLGAALMIQMKHILHTDKLPMSAFAKQFDKDNKVAGEN